MLVFKINNMKLKGSMTVEAALALPIFIFFIINLLSIIISYEKFCNKLKDTHSKVLELSKYAYSYQELVGNEMSTIGDLVKIEPLIDIVGYKKKYVVVKLTARNWTGYDVLSGSDIGNIEEYVYVTEHGQVYHKDRGCRHLKISIRVVSIDDLSIERNESGGRYYSCEQCNGDFGTGIVFITDYGDRYHSNSVCSSLKRTINTIPIKEAASYRACSACGGLR